MRKCLALSFGGHGCESETGHRAGQLQIRIGFRWIRSNFRWFGLEKYHPILIKPQTLSEINQIAWTRIQIGFDDFWIYLYNMAFYVMPFPNKLAKPKSEKEQKQTKSSTKPVLYSISTKRIKQIKNFFFFNSASPSQKS